MSDLAQQAPSQDPEKKNEGNAVVTEPFPNNAKITNMGFWSTFFAKCSDLLFRFMRLDPIADDIEKHHKTIRKVALVRFVIIMATIVGFSSWEIKGCFDDSKIESLKTDLSKSEGAKLEAERDRDKYQIQLTEAQNALAPWKELANSQFPGEPLNKSLELLLQKVDSLQKSIQPLPLKDRIKACLDKISPEFLKRLVEGLNQSQGFMPQYQLSEIQELASESGASQFIQIQGGSQISLGGPNGQQVSYCLTLDKSLLEPTNLPSSTSDKKN